MKIDDKFYRHNVVRDMLCHVRGFVDDQIVYRHWHKRHQCWMYDSEPQWAVDWSFEHGMYLHYPLPVGNKDADAA